MPDQYRICQSTVSGGDYQVRYSDETTDPEWDAFVAQAPGGHHVQTSMWGQVKAGTGWRVTRVILSNQQRVVAGGQLLMRAMSPFGTIGYVTKGPVCPRDNPALADLAIGELRRVGKAHHLRYLVIQPPNDGVMVAQRLADWEFQRSWVALAPTATVRIDLAPDLGDILARMKRQTRQNIRRGEKRGIQVREGTASNLATFYQLHLATSTRQGFRPYPEQYFTDMWRLLDPSGYIKLFVAVYETENVAALLTVPFGDTVIAKVLGWSGLRGDCRPNETLFWGAIKWAKLHGYRYFDFEGIDPKGAKEVLAGRPLPETLHETPTRFKLTFGGEVVLYPEPYDYVPNRLLRLGYTAISPRLEGWSAGYDRLLDYIRRA